MHQGESLAQEKVEVLERSILGVLHAKSLESGPIDLVVQVLEQEPAWTIIAVVDRGPSIGRPCVATSGETGWGAPGSRFSPKILPHGSKTGAGSG